MPSPQSGKSGTAVTPTASQKALVAANANPGKIDLIKAGQSQTQTGKSGSGKLSAHKPPASPEEKAKKKSWIEIKLVDEENQPVPGEPYQVKLPDGTVADGTLDAQGRARVEGFEPGSCEVSFPKLDRSVWDPA